MRASRDPQLLRKRVKATTAAAAEAALSRKSAAGGGITLADAAAAWGAADRRRWLADSAAARAWKAYTTTCGRYHTPPLPLSLPKLEGFALIELIEGRGSQTLGKLISALRSYAIVERLATDGLDDAELRALKGTLRRMCKEYPGTIKRVEPMLDDTLKRVHRFLAPFLSRGDLYALMWWAMLLTARDGCLRSIEYLGDALTASQVTRTKLPDGRPTFALSLDFRKTHKDEHGRNSSVVLPIGHGVLSAPAALDAYIAAAHITPGKGAWPVFPRRRRVSGGVVDGTRGTHDYQAALDDLRWILEKAGVGNAKDFGMHSMRGGLPTELLALGAQPQSVLKFGDWSDPRSMALYDARRGELAGGFTVLRESARTGRAAPRTGQQAALPAARRAHMHTHTHTR